LHLQWQDSAHQDTPIGMSVALFCFEHESGKDSCVQFTIGTPDRWRERTIKIVYSEMQGAGRNVPWRERRYEVRNEMMRETLI